jgi:hypothetical protein
MITSAPDAIALHEKSIDEMWGRALKGQAAAACLRHLLANDGKPSDADELNKFGNFGTKRQSRGKSSSSLM